MDSTSVPASAIWITGITSSGKTVLGRSLYERLIAESGIQLEFVDGDDYRRRFKENYGHTMEDRLLLCEKWVEIIREKNRNGITVIMSTVSHKKAMRDYARSKISRFMEVYLDCSPEVCAIRDHKGLYRRAQMGEFDLFPGVTEPYEPSDIPDLTLSTERMPFSVCANVLYREVASFLGIGS
jgi:adenylylsulfate kinase